MGVEARQARSHRPGGGQRPRGSQSQGVGGAAPAAEAPTHRAGVLPRSEPALHHRLNSPPTYIRLGRCSTSLQLSALPTRPDPADIALITAAPPAVRQASPPYLPAHTP